MWYRIISSCFYLLSTTIKCINTLTDEQRRTLKCSKKKGNWLGSSEEGEQYSSRTLTEFYPTEEDNPSPCSLTSDQGAKGEPGKLIPYQDQRRVLQQHKDIFTKPARKIIDPFAILTVKEQRKFAPSAIGLSFSHPTYFVTLHGQGTASTSKEYPAKQAPGSILEWG